MQGSNIQEFGLNLQYCRNLKNLDLSDCKRLRSTPNFRGSRSLETLRLDNCSSLKKIHPSIGSLDRLTSLSFGGCKKITDLPSSIRQLKSLEYLNICDCILLQTLPDDIGDMQSLIYLCAFDTGIKQFPRSIEMLINLEELEVGSRFLEANGIFSRRRLHRIESLPIFISELSLSYCDLSEADVPRDIGSLSNLTTLDLRGNGFLYLPFDFSELTLLMYLYLNDCENLETLPSVSNLQNLEILDLMNCEKLVKITGLDNLPSIQEIDTLNCTSLQNPFNEGFFSAQALSYPSRKDQKDKLLIFVECNEIPDWCSNKVTAPSICLTMPTVHNNEYKLLGMVLWFVCDFFHPCNVHFYVTVADKKHSVFEWFCQTKTSRSGGKESSVYYICCLQKPFDGLKMKVGGKIAFKEDAGKGMVKKIGIHLLYLDQHGNVTSLPAIVDHSSTHYLQRLTAEHIDDNNNIPNELPHVRSGTEDINSSLIKEQSSEAVFNTKKNVFLGKCFFGKCFSGK